MQQLAGHSADDDPCTSILIRFFPAFKDCSLFSIISSVLIVFHACIKRTVPQVKPRKKEMRWRYAHISPSIDSGKSFAERTNGLGNSNLNTNCHSMESNMNYFVLLILQNGNRLKNLFAPLRFMRRGERK